MGRTSHGFLHEVVGGSLSVDVPGVLAAESQVVGCVELFADIKAGHQVLVVGSVVLDAGLCLGALLRDGNDLWTHTLQ